VPCHKRKIEATAGTEVNDNDDEPIGLRQALQRLGMLVKGRDIAVVEEFAPDGMLIGSEPGEIARGHHELTAFFTALFAKPVSVIWDWETLDLHASGANAWVFAEGAAVLDNSTGSRRLPYRLSGVLEAVGPGWKWRLFHGSEPRV
jgi:ketosteroid isomerase-like protein